MSDPSFGCDEITFTGADAIEKLNHALESWPAGMPPPKIRARGFTFDKNGHVFYSRDEDMRLTHPDDWLSLSEDERDYLMNKHGPHNRPIGV